MQQGSSSRLVREADSKFGSMRNGIALFLVLVLRFARCCVF